MASEPVKSNWEVDCLQFYGMVLTGKLSHWCDSFDDLPMDETCAGFELCQCYSDEEKKAAIDNQVG